MFTADKVSLKRKKVGKPSFRQISLKTVVNPCTYETDKTDVEVEKKEEVRR